MFVTDVFVLRSEKSINVPLRLFKSGFESFLLSLHIIQKQSTVILLSKGTDESM